MPALSPDLVSAIGLVSGGITIVLAIFSGAVSGYRLVQRRRAPPHKGEDP